MIATNLGYGIVEIPREVERVQLRELETLATNLSRNLVTKIFVSCIMKTHFKFFLRVQAENENQRDDYEYEFF